MVIYMKNSKKEEAQKVKEELNDFDSIQNQLLERSEYEDSLRSCLLSLFHEKEVDISSEVSGINTNVNCFFLLPNRKKDDFCYDELAQVMLHEIVNYVIPRQKATEAHESKRRNVELSRLQQEAKRKFIDFWKKKKEFERKSLEGKSHKSEQESGEGGELLLFLLAEQILRLPQAICKMMTKTSGKMPVYGSDGIHIGLNEDKSKLALYYGEAKVKKSKSKAVTDCLESLKKLLVDRDEEFELELLCNNFQLEKEHLEIQNKLLEYFKFSNFRNKEYVEVRGICLIAFDTKTCYNEIDREKIANKISKKLKEWVLDLKVQTINNSLKDVFLHVLFIPMPSVDKFRNAFRKVINND